MSSLKLFPSMIPNWYSTGLGLVLALALVLRITGLTWGYPYGFNVDENHVVMLAQQIAQRFAESGSLNPMESSYGALPLYLLVATTTLAHWLLSWVKTFLFVPFDSVPMLYVGRLLSIVESVATVWLTAELARRLFGPAVALLSGLLLSVSLLPIREAHFATVDTLLVALIALALLLGERVARRGSWSDYVMVGVAVALAAATKVTAVLLAAPILVAHVWSLLRTRGDQYERTDIRNLNSGGSISWATTLPRLVMAGAITGVLWLLINPYVLLDPKDYFDLDRNDSILSQWLVVRGNLPVLYTLQFTGTLPFLYVISNWLRWGMSLPLEIIALAGVAYSLWNLLKSCLAGAAKPNESTVFADAYLLSWLLIYFASTGSWFAKFIRYALPLIPILCVLASRFLIDLWQRDGLMMRGLAVGLTFIAVIPTLAYSTAYLSIYRQPDVRLSAVEWLKGQVPTGSSVLVEKDEGLFLHRENIRNRMGLSGYKWQIWDPYQIDGVHSMRFEAPAVSESQTRAHLDRLLTTDYVVISTFWYDRFSAAAQRFPAQAEFYRRLFNGEAGYSLIRKFQVYPQLGPFTWRDDEAEFTFRLFDHPAVYIFARE